MRLSSATLGVLASGVSLPVVLSSVRKQSVNAGPSSLTHAYRKQKRSNFALKRNYRVLTNRNRRLANKGDPLDEKLVECQPSSYSSTENEADLGVLACGPGLYCQESRESNLGGFCVPDDVTGTTMDTSRFLQQAANVSGTDLCDESSDYFGAYDCNCDGFDLVSETGTIECIVYQSCLEMYVDCDHICLTDRFVYTVEPNGNFFYESCYDFYSPINETICYAYNELGDCAISINEEVCNSCDYMYGGNNVTYYCTEFDCTNTEAMNEGNSCYGDSAAPLFEECTFELNRLCYVCGDAPVAYPDNLVELPLIGNVTCYDVDLNTVLSEPDECALVTSYAADICCSAVTPAPVTPAPVATPAPNTAAPVSPAPVTPAPVSPAPEVSTTTFSPITPAPVDTPTETPSEDDSAATSFLPLHSKNVASFLGLTMAVAVYFAS